jgi:predicted RNase H-like HicB family nuclease
MTGVFAWFGDITMTLSIRIRPCESGGFRAACTTLPGCAAKAQTAEEAREKLGEAIVGYLASMDHASPEAMLGRLIEV